MTSNAPRSLGDVFQDRLQDRELASWDEEERVRGITNVDLYSENGLLILEAELPGAKADDIDIQVDQQTLSLTATRSTSREDSGKDYFIRESRRGSVSRTIPLPHPVDTNETKANFEEGVLRVTMPKQDDGTSRKVEVQ